MIWFVLALLGAVMRAGQFAVVKAWTRDVPPVVLSFSAITMVPASYVNSVRRMGAVLSVMLGSALADEPAVGDRLGGALLASAGAVLLLLG